MSVAPSNFPLSPFPLDMYLSIPCIVLACPVSLFLPMSLPPHPFHLFPLPEIKRPTNLSGSQPQQHLVLPPKQSHHPYALHWPIDFPPSRFYSTSTPQPGTYTCMCIPHRYQAPLPSLFSASVSSQTQHTPDLHHSAFSFSRPLRELLSPVGPTLPFTI